MMKGLMLWAWGALDNLLLIGVKPISSGLKSSTASSMSHAIIPDGFNKTHKSL